MTNASPTFTPPPNDEDLPFRLRESTFRIYEPYIVAAVKGWPDPVTINPAPLRATTVSARLRDAILSLRTFRWSTTIDMEVFDKVESQIQVTHSDHSVALGPKGKRVVPGFQMQTTSHASLGIHFNKGNHDEADLTAICRLLGKRLISGPIYIYPPIHETQVATLESTFDVAIDSTADRTTIV